MDRAKAIAVLMAQMLVLGKGYPSYREAMEMAIDALREQEQREQGCEYCRPPFRNLFSVTIDPETGEEIITIFVDCDGQALRLYDDNPYNPQIDKVPINFCPMCGRKLKEGAEG